MDQRSSRRGNLKTVDEVMDDAKVELAQIIEQYEHALRTAAYEKNELQQDLKAAQVQSEVNRQNADNANLRCVTLLRRLQVANQRADDEAQNAERKFYDDWLQILKEALSTFLVNVDEILGRFEELMMTYETPRDSEPSTLLIPGMLNTDESGPSHLAYPEE